jgi:hypothetical protein
MPANIQHHPLIDVSLWFQAMNASLFRARQLSLALLVIAVVEHGHLNADYTGASPNTSGLLRLGRDLLRRKSEAAPTNDGCLTSGHRSLT